ncbi:MAG TPA: hypothetical protein VHK06_03150 [Candidatus Limnocylindria bacterium]|nr:hypothetical protein [Candidatus Limnocylindria bacterium]
MTDRVRDGSPGRAELARRLTFWVAAGLALLAGHDAVSLVQLGPGRTLAEQLRTAGHAYWPVATWLLLLAAAAAALWWAARLAHLRRLAGPASAVVRPSGGAIGWRRRAAGAWARLFAVVAIGFVLQENVEHAAVHGHILGTGALFGPEYPLALPVLAVVTAFVATLIAAIGQREATLILQIARNRLPARAPRGGMPRPAPDRVVRRDPLALHRSGRAPPAPSLATLSG